MNWRIINTALALLTLVFLYSCDKQEEQGYIRLDVANYSEVAIDTLKIYSSSTNITYSIYKEPTVFWNITSGYVTETRDVNDVEYCLHFIGYIKADSIKGSWIYPNFLVDPTQPLYMPNGHYSFGIIECDTAIGRMVVGLINDVTY